MHTPSTLVARQHPFLNATIIFRYQDPRTGSLEMIFISFERNFNTDRLSEIIAFILRKSRLNRDPFLHGTNDPSEENLQFFNLANFLTIPPLSEREIIPRIKLHASPIKQCRGQARSRRKCNSLPRLEQ